LPAGLETKDVVGDDREPRSEPRPGLVAVFLREPRVPAHVCEDERPDSQNLLVPIRRGEAASAPIITAWHGAHRGL